jgi:cytochrome d ubiquinol oxidase subunit II
VFAVASTITPLFLGASLAALTSGQIRVVDGMPTTGFYVGWWGAFPVSVGLFAIALFALIAAVYLSFETRGTELEGDFVARALGAEVVAFFCGLAAALNAAPEALAFRSRLLGSWWTLPLLVATSIAALGCIVGLLIRRLRVARACVVAQVTLILLGWGAAQFPFLIAPDLTLENAAAPVRTLELLVPSVIAGTLLLAPSLYFLFRIFKGDATPGSRISKAK